MVAIVAVLLRDVLPPIDVISAWSERLVGAALIAVGLWALRHALRIGDTPHVHDGAAHEHLHVQRGTWARTIGHAHASFFMGVLHGVAGSSHFLGVLPALALPTRSASLAYIAAFGAGSILAMTGFGAAIGRATGPRTYRTCMLAAASLACGVGAIWLVI